VDFDALALRLAEPTQTPYQEIRRWPLRELMMASVRHALNQKRQAEAKREAMEEARKDR
jgi:hypothetical protein